jgi:1-aminocyclopropane-1-carboxylate deaminase
MHLPISNISLDKIESHLLLQKGIKLSILRLDKIHEDVSGNKLFKLHYFIENCLQTAHKTLLTFGGAYSNHLVATAFLCKANNINCVGIVRGEKPAILSHTLLKCEALGMQLQFVSRSDYKNMDDTNAIEKKYGACTIVPEGGYDTDGAKGASLIMNILKGETATYICTCVGTGTTLAGLLIHNSLNAEIIAVPAIKNMTDIQERILFLSGKKYNPTIFGDYHFGGYAKYDEKLIQFMNTFYAAHQIPTDFVYTAKMLYAIMDNIENNYFKSGSSIICIHTGGLQGNNSLPKNSLIF